MQRAAVRLMDVNMIWWEMRGHGGFFIKGLSNESSVFKIFIWEWYLSEIEKENRVSGSD